MLTGKEHAENGDLVRPDEVRDEILLASSKEDPRLFETLVARYQEPFLRAALRVVHRREDAEDIVQEAFIKLYRNADKFQKQKDVEFKSWAYKVLVNTSFTHYQRLKRRRLKESDDGEELMQWIPVESGKKASEDGHFINHILAGLPEDLRTALTSHYLEDKAYETMASENGATVAAVKMKLYRARQAFKKLAGGHAGY